MPSRVESKRHNVRVIALDSNTDSGSYLSRREALEKLNVDGISKCEARMMRASLARNHCSGKWPERCDFRRAESIF